MIKTYSNKNLTPPIKVIVWVIGIFIILVNAFNGGYPNCILGAFIIYLSGFKKEIRISNEALIIEMNAFKTHYVQEIAFSEIEVIKIETLGNKSFIHFIKKNAGRKIEVDKESIPEIKKWICDKNKNVIIS